MYLIRMLLVLYALVPRQNMEPQHCCSINFNQTKALLALGLPYSKINAAELTQSRWGGNKYNSLLKTKCRPIFLLHLKKMLHPFTLQISIFLVPSVGPHIRYEPQVGLFYPYPPLTAKGRYCHYTAWHHSDKNLSPLPLNCCHI